MPDLYVDDKARKALLDKLDYLNEARTRIAHNNPVSGEDNIKIKDYANQVRQLLPQLKPQT
jgi:flagellar biosynthesis/type III secretory pathway chaperone